MVNVKIYRYSPKDKAPHYDSFQVDFKPEERKTVMNLLEYISENLDGSLAFYDHSACRHGICGRCAVKVNGKVKLSCITVIEGEEILLEPASQKVIRDLVIEN